MPILIFYVSQIVIQAMIFVNYMMVARETLTGVYRPMLIRKARPFAEHGQNNRVRIVLQEMPGRWSE
jgi:hypothetical protein